MGVVGRLLLIHGRAQEEFDEHDLKKEWIEALNRGLEKSGLVLKNNP